MVSIADVAEAAGVSPATASRVLSNSTYPVRDETRERVLAAARETGFRPNLLARALATSRTSIVSVIVHDISDPYFGEVVRGLEDRASAHGYQVLVSSSDRDPAREVQVLELLLGYQVDAVVFAGGGLDDDEYASEIEQLLRAFADDEGAVVHLAPHPGADVQVTVDNVEGAERMTSHLLELGHRQIGFIAGPSHLSTARLRLDGYRQALESAGLAIDPSLVEIGHFTSTGGRAATRALLDRRPDITALFAANDMMALGVVSELQDRHLSVPGDVSVAGFDDLPVTAFVSPPLSTVSVPMRQLGEHGFDAVIRILEGRTVSSVVLPTGLVVRASTATPGNTVHPLRPGGVR